MNKIRQEITPFQKEIILYYQTSKVILISSQSLKTIKDSSKQLYVVSKQWFRQWQYYVEYIQGIAPNEKREKPGALNCDLCSKENFLLKYPRDNSFNQQIIKLQSEDFILVNKLMIDVWGTEYGVGMTIPRNVYFNQQGVPSLNVNLLRQSVYINVLNPQRGVLQVDQDCIIKQWIQLLCLAIKNEFQVNVEQIRLWKHKHFQADYAIKQLEKHQGHFNGEILNENLTIGSYNADLIIIDIQIDGKWQYDQLDIKISCSEDFRHIYQKASKGCGKFICDRNYCKSNPIFSQIEFDRKTLQYYLIEQFKQDYLDWTTVCWNQINELKPIQQLQDNDNIVVALTELSIFPNSFGASFILNFNNCYDVINYKNSNPELNLSAIQLVNDVLDAKTLKLWMENLVSNYKQSIYFVRAIIIIMHFKCFNNLLYQEGNRIIEVFLILSKEDKDLLSNYLKILPDEYFIRYTSTIIEIMGNYLKQQSKKHIPLLKKTEIQFVKQMLELLQVFYNSNKTLKLLNLTRFQISEIATLYPKYGNQLEYIQFDSYSIQNLERYYFTFCQYPWVIPLEFKSEILAIDSKMNQKSQFQNSFMFYQPFLQLMIDRNDVVTSALVSLSRKDINLKAQLQIVFQGEQGIDQGGLAREFFSLLTQKLFDINFGMFVPKNNNSILWFNKNNMEMPFKYELIGMILGLALYNQVCLDLQFPEVIFKKLMNEPTCLEDLKELDLEVYKGLNALAQYEQDNIEDVFALNFTITETIRDDIINVELLPNGTEIMVTQQNKHEYIRLCTNYYLNLQIETTFNSFKQGFWRVVEGNGIKLFSGSELQQLIVGQKNLNLKELEDSTEYDGFDYNSEYIKQFWTFLRTLNEEQQKRFLFFCTGSDRIPVGGLKSLKFLIQKHGEDSEQLPSAHTCFNVLLLPQYDSIDKMIMKLQIALQNCEGFGLM
ncbi:unnamed protein product (macronuclear) [Paramecium tetraurelia]|uniref:HECT-type E3 ubiquitin transferase n=1 Tax=Paramecium tetraurelia TaxID=5888 RepID=A0CKD6_PARTE|nr:uncharacterized protein GSPATT00000966001 [Paramecium tetraurelia]CAK71253.1 unnamed protein product [Paramecium tetraurelia]|eukprot:XP_001438650.1 hypothetical protein (macronuclear) [Paramecium tetraurelia strain d4-2]